MSPGRVLMATARLLRTARALSLDVLLGAACGGLLAERATGTRMPAAWWLALLATVWAVYAADHLLDARASRGPLLTHRHRFFRRHAHALFCALVVDVALAALAAACLPPRVIAFGAALLACCLLYLASAQGLVAAWLPREPVAGVGYAAGIWGAPLLASGSLGAWVWLAAGLHALGAILNLVAYGLFEARVDARQGSRSLALSLGSGATRTVVLWVGVAGCVLSCWAAGMAPHELRAVFVVLALIAATPPAMLLRREWFSRLERFRIWGDLVFAAAALPWLLGRLPA